MQLERFNNQVDEWADDPAQLDSDLSAALVVTDAGDVRIDVQ